MSLKRVYIEITNRCNLNCGFCPPSARPPRIMSAAEFEGLAADVSRHTRHIYLHVKGEPLAHPQLGEILEIARRHGLYVNLTTNAVLLPRCSGLLLQSSSLRQTNFSIHGYTPSTHGDLEAWMAALCSYARCSASLGRYTVFRFWTLPQSRQADGDSAEAIRILELEFPFAGGIALQASRRSAELSKNIFASFDEQFRWPTMADPVLGTEGTCYGARTMVGILADGTVVPCCLDSEGACPLGNAFTQSLDAILSSPRYLNMSGSFANRHVTEPLCQRCSYRIKFSRKHPKETGGTAGV